MDLRFLAQMHHIYDMQFSFMAAQLRFSMTDETGSFGVSAQHQSDNCSIWAKANRCATLAHFNENVLYGNVLHSQWCYSASGWIPNISLTPRGKTNQTHNSLFTATRSRRPLCTHHSKPILPVSHSNSSTRPSLAENVASIFHYVLCCFTPWQKPKHVFESCLLVSSGLYFDNIHVSKLRIWQSWTFCLICQTQGESEFFSAWENTSRNPFLSNYIHIPGLFR